MPMHERNPTPCVTVPAVLDLAGKVAGSRPENAEAVRGAQAVSDRAPEWDPGPQGIGIRRPAATEARTARAGPRGKRRSAGPASRPRPADGPVPPRWPCWGRSAFRPGGDRPTPLRSGPTRPADDTARHPPIRRPRPAGDSLRRARAEPPVWHLMTAMPLRSHRIESDLVRVRARCRRMINRAPRPAAFASSSSALHGTASAACNRPWGADRPPASPRRGPRPGRNGPRGPPK